MIEFDCALELLLRPAQGNRSMVIEDEGIRDRVRDLTVRLIGRGEPLE